jgi:hypothetical protein
MNVLKVFIIFTISTLLASCASNYGVTYDSEPRGASLICGGINQGYTPTTLYYKLSEENKKSGTLNTVPCHAIWISGASDNFSSSFSLSQFPNGVMNTLQRPNVEGYTQDAQFALQVENMKTQKRQAAAAESASNAVQNYNSNAVQNYNSNSPKACKMFGDLSGRIYYFQNGFCPVGYY